MTGTELSEQDWIDWIDDHPFTATVMMLAIWALCWAGVIMVFWGVAGLVGLGKAILDG